MKDALTVADARTLQIGGVLIEVYGDAQSGWGVACDGFGLLPSCYRYQSIDELIFALATLAITPDGDA